MYDLHCNQGKNNFHRKNKALKSGEKKNRKKKKKRRARAFLNGSLSQGGRSIHSSGNRKTLGVFTGEV